MAELHFHLTNEQLEEIGWTQDQIYMGLAADVVAFIFIKDEEDEYNIIRNLIPRTYSIEEDVMFKGEKWDRLILTWCR